MMIMVMVILRTGGQRIEKYIFYARTEKREAACTLLVALASHKYTSSSSSQGRSVWRNHHILVEKQHKVSDGSTTAARSSWARSGQLLGRSKFKLAETWHRLGAHTMCQHPYTPPKAQQSHECGSERWKHSFNNAVQIEAHVEMTNGYGKRGKKIYIF